MVAASSVVDVSTSTGWDAVREQVLPPLVHTWHDEAATDDQPDVGPSTPFERVIEIARMHDVQTVLIEDRYIDPEWQSEHSMYYGRTFDRPPNVSKRLHFFKQQLATFADLARCSSADYVGYSVIRPLATAPVGRTMIVPPPGLSSPTLCLGREPVHLFGHEFTVEAMPFISQDSRFLRCAHAAMWMVLYHAKLRHRLPRRVPEDIWRAAFGGEVLGRQLPHDGMSVAQMLSALHRLGISARHIDLTRRRPASEPTWDLQKSRTLLTTCSYVNSQMPPLAYTSKHVTVIAGYTKQGTGNPANTIKFVEHDDQRGPYLTVDNMAKRGWWGLVEPLEPNVFVSAEHAQRLGRTALRMRAEFLGDSLLTAAFADNRVALRTYGVLTREYRAGLSNHRLSNEITDLFRYVSWPKGVWVVEALDRDLWDNGGRDSRDCVLGEVVLDATAEVRPYSEPDKVPRADVMRAMVGIHIGGNGLVFPADGAQARVLATSAPFGPYRSGCPSTPW